MSMETIFMNMENSKINDPHKLLLSLPQRLELSSSNKKCCSSELIYLLHLGKYKKTV